MKSYSVASFFVFILICLSFYPGLAQQKIFTPAKDDESTLRSIDVLLKNRYERDIADLPSENKKELSKIYKQRWDNLQEKVDKKEIYTDPFAQQYLDAIVAEIVKANPLMQHKDFNCYFSHSGIPNAEYLGEGLILINMGLFIKLDNESQLAFVICHELSHFYLRHSENSIQKYVSTLNSDEVQKELRNIKRSDYGKREELEKLLKGITFDSRRHGRDHESSADSMGLGFLRNTRFDISEALTALSLLDSIDTDTLKTGEVLQKSFNAKEYPFQGRWIAKEEGLLGGHAKLTIDSTLADSLKTHPDCKKRIRILEPMVMKYVQASSSKNVVNKNTFDQLVQTFNYEMIAFAFASDDYTESLYYTLELSEKYPNDPYLVTQTGRILNGFYNAQKNHTLGKVAELPAPFYPVN